MPTRKTSRPRRFQLEICIDSVASARAAAEGGADRVELCQDLFAGGITPSAGLLAGVRQAVTLGLQVLIRPRGGDFCYTADELDVMARDIQVARDLGADGIVTGVLKPNGTVDHRAMRRLIRAAGPLPVTFHRAFDVTRDPWEALQAIRDLGCERILTSGQEATVLEGSELIAALVRRAGRAILIMPGGGITERNFARIRRLTGAREFHLSARRTVPTAMRHRPDHVFMGGVLRPPEFGTREADAAMIGRLRWQRGA